VNAREQWRTLHALLTSARSRFEEGDRAAAIEAVRTALALDPDFLAAQSLLDRILEPEAAGTVEPPVTAIEKSVRAEVPAPAPNELEALPERPGPPPSPTPPVRPLLAVFTRLEQEAELRRSRSREPLPVDDEQPILAANPEPMPPAARQRPPAAEVVIAPAHQPDFVPVASHDHALVPVPDLAPVPARYDEVDAALGHQVGPARDYSLTGTVEELWPDRDESHWGDLDEFRAGTKRDPDANRLERHRAPRATPHRRRLALLAAAAVFGAVVLEESWRQEAAWLASQSMASITTAHIDSPEPRDSTPAPVEPAPAADAAIVTDPGPATSGTSNSSPTANVSGPTNAGTVAEGEGQTKPAVSKANETTSAELQRVRAIVAAEALADRRGADTAEPVRPAVPPLPGATPPPTDAVVAASAGAKGSPGNGSPSEVLERPAVADDTPPPAAPAPTAPAGPDDEMMIQRVLQRYRAAYQVLDARSARDVWPAVNQAALSRAFGGLESQTLSFDECDVRVRGSAGGATCRGTASYVPKVGSREERVESRTWTFVLRKIGADWVIQSVRTDR
jgi:hypothetical protein